MRIPTTLLLFSSQKIKIIEAYRCDEELWTIGVFAGIRHTQPASAIMLQFEILVGESLSIDTLTTGTITTREITAWLQN